MNDQELKEARLAFLNDTIQYYSEDVSRRAINLNPNNSRCMYKTPDGRKCAIGRHMLEDKQPREGMGPSFSVNQSCLPDKIKELGFPFLAVIQGLHDTDMNWIYNGLSSIGLEKVRYIKELYKLN